MCAISEALLGEDHWGRVATQRKAATCVTQQRTVHRLLLPADKQATDIFLVQGDILMKRYLGVLLAGVLLSVLGSPARADDKEVKAILDRAIKAVGGEDKLARATAFTWKTRGATTVLGKDNPFTRQATAQGLDHYRAESENEIDGNTVKGMTIINGERGWRKFGEQGREMNEPALARMKRSIYLTVVPMTLLPLRGKGFKIEKAGEEKVGGKAAVGLKVTGPDDKEFKIFFDKESGLPVKLVATVQGFPNKEVKEEITYSGYKEFSGIKIATRRETRHDGEKFMKQEITEFKLLPKVDAKTFALPK
jgi:hypothetical protein